jgi:putative nucleotidyltransferase with HDIG domain
MFVDDEVGIRHALKRMFIDSTYCLYFAASSAEALDLLRANEFALIVSDNHMPGDSGIELLSKARIFAPDTMRVLMTAYADMETALDAINRCEAYRFVVKPWNNEELFTLVDECVLRYELLTSLRRGDEAIYRTLAQTIDMKDHYTRGHCDRVVDYALAIGRQMGLSGEVLRNIEHGALLHDCGKIGVPEATLNFPGPLNKDQLEVMRRHPGLGADVARTAGLHQSAVNIILCHHEHYNGQGFPAGLSGEDIPLEARIVSVADVYDALTSDRPYRKALPLEIALHELNAMSGTVLDPQFVELFLDILNSNTQGVQCE